MLGNLLLGFVTVLIGVNLLPVVANQVEAATWDNGTHTTNVTGASSTIVGLTTLFFAIAVMTAGIGLAVGGLRNAGVL